MTRRPRRKEEARACRREVEDVSASRVSSGAAVKSEVARRASSVARASSKSRREVVWSMGRDGEWVEENGRRDEECCGRSCEF